MRHHPGRALCDGIAIDAGGRCPGAECRYRPNGTCRISRKLAELGGPGTELKAIMAGYRIPTCGECAVYAAKMDQWGWECRDRKAEIVAHLEAQAKKLSWGQWLSAAGHAVVGGDWSVANMVDKALRRAEAKDQPSGPAVQVCSQSSGIGDHLLTLAIAEGVRRKSPDIDVVYRCEPWVRPWVELFWDGRVTHRRLYAPELLCEHANAAWHDFQRRGLARWEYWQREFGVMAAMLPPKSIPDEVAWQAMPYTGHVLIAPFAAFGERTWPVEHWLEVERRLLALGFRCALLHNNTTDARLTGFRSVRLDTNGRPQLVAALMRNATAVLGNDSGMAHLAGALGVAAVAVTSAASDRNIMGLWRTVRALGPTLEATRPVDVVGAALGIVRDKSGDFPVERFREIIAMRDPDRWRLPCWEIVYANLWHVIRKLAPRSVVEIGVRAGYSAWVMFDAYPEIVYYGIDAERVEHGSFSGATEHAACLLCQRKATLTTRDSREIDGLPSVDLCYIDGDHTEAGCTNDLLLAERSSIKRILVDDMQLEGPRTAVRKFCHDRPGVKRTFYPSDTGLMLLEIP